MEQVWSITIKGKTDCVILDESQAMIVKMKFMPDIQMHNLTELHGMKPSYLHKIERKKSLDNDSRALIWMKAAYESGGMGGWPGEYEKPHWEYQDLIDMKTG